MKADQPDFACAICRRRVDMRWNFAKGGDRIIPPICRPCERDFSQGVGKPVAGSHMDRRNVTRGVALAEALRTAASHQQWGGSFGQP